MELNQLLEMLQGQNIWVYGIALVAFFLLRSQSGNGLMEGLINLLRGVTNTPGETFEGPLDASERVLAAKELADHCKALGHEDHSQAILGCLPCLVMEVEPSEDQ